MTKILGRFALIAAIHLTTAIAPVFAQPITSEEAYEFFDRQKALADDYSPAFADAYLDTSRIKGKRRYPTGHERVLEMNGEQWKQVMLLALPLARAKGDRNEFKNVRIETVDELLRIRASRYSVLRCYWDDQFYVLIGRQPDGSLKIIEEYQESQSYSSCSESLDKAL